MTVTYELTPEDYWQYNLYHRRHKATLRPVFLYAFAGLIALMLIGGLYLFVDSWIKFHQVHWSLLFYLAAATFFVIRALPPTKARLVKKTAKQPGVFCEHTHGISPEWTAHKTPVNDSKMAWTTVHSIEENDAYLYLFLSKNAAYIIPKRAFSSLSEAQAFLDRSRRYWQAAKEGTPFSTEEGEVWPPAPRLGA